MNPRFKTPFAIILPLLMLLTASCSVSRSNVEKAKNLEYQIKAFSKDPSQARQLIKAMEQSAETFITQGEPKKVLTMLEEVYQSLPKSAVPVEHIKAHALVKSHILETYANTAKTAGKEKRALKFLEGLRAAHLAEPGAKQDATTPIDHYIDSLKSPEV